jgi:hypothetical protein
MRFVGSCNGHGLAKLVDLDQVRNKFGLTANVDNAADPGQANQ